ncbi:hypothetical protein ACIOHE_39065 [Streptomyces sp. NPDC087851]|uniref:hypothetical protein n=1 Tax=Streptomyces sp. NPDC087851 TaxID=3365810 RepID=UPI003802530C
MPIPVVRSEAYYLPPPREPADSYDCIPVAERVFTWLSYRTGRRLIPPVGNAEQVYFARVNQNRWIVDCACGAAQVTSPTDPRSACTQCGLGWCALVFPADPDAVETELLDLLPHLRNWWHPDDPANPNRPEPEPQPEPEPAPDPEPEEPTS